MTNCGEQGCTHTYASSKAAVSETFRLSAANLLREGLRALRDGDARRARCYSIVLDSRIQEAQRAAGTGRE